ncbi:non-hydrolyzing UDP-N-acetylglucosamine 2-epimerase [Candidatus Omnitrophota bacterium]
MGKIKIINIVGTRPNFIKMAPLQRLMEEDSIFDVTLVHTGQHYDDSMSEVFFKGLKISPPIVNLGVGSGTHGYQIAEIIKRLEPILIEKKPDLVVVVGDVNSSLAAAFIASMLRIKIAHIEAGMRSFNRNMPEEINRVVIDQLSDFLFTTDTIADENLLREGIKKEKIFRVGDAMIDALFQTLEDQVDLRQKKNSEKYAVLTLHRNTTVDDLSTLRSVLKAVSCISERIPVVFPIHPRTKKMISCINNFSLSNNVVVKEPMSHKEFIHLVSAAQFVMTDSGGVQKEATALDVPCLTLRNETEWLDTISKGTNLLVGVKKELIVGAVNDILSGKRKHKQDFELWDGKASGRIIKILIEHLVDSR